MRLRDDERGQSVQIGAVLLFATLIIAFSSYQAFVVPDQNRAVEFNHNQQVQGELQDLRNAVVSMPGGGSPRSTAVTLGTTYPSRAVAQNPPPPYGTLRTVGTTDSAVNVSVRNAAADGETGDFWTGEARNYTTGAVEFRPGYNVYSEAPTTVYEHSILHNRFRSASLVVADQTVVDGNRISLVALNGSLAHTTSRTVSVDARPISSSTRTVTLSPEDPSQPIAITFPSRLPVPKWNEMLAGNDGVTAVPGSVDYPEPFEAVTIELSGNDPYTLQLTKVGVGNDATGEPPAYLTDVAGEGATVTAGESRELTLEVRDAYDNPVSDVTVNASAGHGSFADADDRKTTGDNGQVTFIYETAATTETGTHLVNFTSNRSTVLDERPFDQSRPKNVSLNVTVEGPAGGNGGGGPFLLHWADPSGQSGVNCPNGPDNVCTVDSTQTSSVDLTAATNPTAVGVDVDYSLNESSAGSLRPGSGETDDAGEDETTFTPAEAGGVTVFTTGGGGGDAIELRVTDFVPRLVYEGDATAMDGPDFDSTPGGVEFSVTNRLGEAATITELRIDPADGAIDTLNDDGTPNDQPVTTEIYVDGDLNDGHVDWNGGTSLPVTADLDADGFNNNGNPQLSDGSTATVYLYEFYAGGSSVDMTGEDVTITVTYQTASGGTQTETFTITPQASGGGEGGGGQSIAYPDEFDDIDYGGAEPGENNAIPPSGDGGGELSGGLTGMQSASDGGSTSDFGARFGGLDVGIATYNVDTTASEYDLVLRYNHPSYRDAVTLRIVDENDNTLQTESLSYTSNDGFTTDTIRLNSQARQYVQDNGDLYVVYTGGGDAYIDVDYQRIEAV